jgi:flagellar biogenesis protein FliO
LKVHHILFLLWIIVFAGWLAKQFSDSNKRLEKRQKALDALE